MRQINTNNHIWIQNETSCLSGKIGRMLSISGQISGQNILRYKNGVYVNVPINVEIPHNHWDYEGFLMARPEGLEPATFRFVAENTQ